MRFQVLNIFGLVSIFFATLLTSCSRVSTIPGKDTPTAFPIHTSTPRIQEVVETPIIGSKNVQKIEITSMEIGGVFSVTLSPDEKTIAILTHDGVYLYDSETLKQKQLINLPIEFSPQSVSISYSPDGNLLAFGISDEIVIWNIAKGEYETRINNGVPDFDVARVEFSPHSNRVVAINSGGLVECDGLGGNFSVYDLASGTVLYSDYFCTHPFLSYFTFTRNGYIVFVREEMPSFQSKVSFVDSLTGVVEKQLYFDGVVTSISSDATRITRKGVGKTDIIDTTTQHITSSQIGEVKFLIDIGSQNGELLFLSEEYIFLEHTNSWIIEDINGKVLCAFEIFPDISGKVINQKLISWNQTEQELRIWDLSSCKLTKQVFISIIQQQ